MESSIAAFLLRWSACELLPTMIQRVAINRSVILLRLCGSRHKHNYYRHRKSAPELLQAAPSTVLAQDHFYNDFLSLSLTILTHKGSLMITFDC